MPLYGHELTEEIDPLQAGLGWAVKLDKGDFRGREALLKRQAGSARCAAASAWNCEGKRIAREGAMVKAAGKEVGVVTSGTFSPTLSKTDRHGLRRSGVQQSRARRCQVDIRGKRRSGPGRGAAVLQSAQIVVSR